MLLERERKKNSEAAKKKATFKVTIAQTRESTTLSWCLSVEEDGFPLHIKQLTESKRSLPLH